jgi:hypothetical protein
VWPSLIAIGRRVSEQSLNRSQSSRPHFERVLHQVPLKRPERGQQQEKKVKNISLEAKNPRHN